VALGALWLHDYSYDLARESYVVIDSTGHMVRRVEDGRTAPPRVACQHAQADSLTWRQLATLVATSAFFTAERRYSDGGPRHMTVSTLGVRARGRSYATTLVRAAGPAGVRAVRDSIAAVVQHAVWRPAAQCPAPN
jgi:hypothetical protein